MTLGRAARLALDDGLEKIGPVGKVFERRDVSVIEFEGGNGDGSVAHRGHVGVGLDAFDDLLLVQPEILSASGVCAGL